MLISIGQWETYCVLHNKYSHSVPTVKISTLTQKSLLLETGAQILKLAVRMVRANPPSTHCCLNSYILTSEATTHIFLESLHILTLYGSTQALQSVSQAGTLVETLRTLLHSVRRAAFG